MRAVVLIILLGIKSTRGLDCLHCVSGELENENAAACRAGDLRFSQPCNSGVYFSCYTAIRYENTTEEPLVVRSCAFTYEPGCMPPEFRTINCLLEAGYGEEEIRGNEQDDRRRLYFGPRDCTWNTTESTFDCVPPLFKYPPCQLKEPKDLNCYCLTDNCNTGSTFNEGPLQ